MSTPGGKRLGLEENAEVLMQELSERHRNAVAPLTYYGADAEIISYATKGLARRLRGPTVEAWLGLMQGSRYLLGRKDCRPRAPTQTR